MENTIFIQIAAYRDPELKKTLKSILENADRPDLLRFGIAWQHSDEDEWDNLDEYKNDSRFRILDINYKDSQGVCWARNKVQQLYNGEKYTLQIDSHHRFASYWDLKLIKMVEDLQADGSPKPLITSYIPSYDPKNDPDGRVNHPWKMNFDRFIPEGAIFFLPGNFDSWDNINKPLPARFYSAHFAFSLGSFAVEVQHDPNYYFHGEEISIAARAFSHGYDLFHPHKVIAWHEYTRAGRIKQWDDDKTWGDKNRLSHQRNRKLFEMDGEINDIDFGKYGFGNERTLQQYERYAGISFKKRAIHQNTIDRKPPDYSLMMLKDDQFEKSLTRIFKHCIDQLKESIPPLDDYDFWAVIFEDRDGGEIYREDLTSVDILNLKNESPGDPFYHIWREFRTGRKPHQYVIWPHSLSKGWGNKIVHVI